MIHFTSAIWVKSKKQNMLHQHISYCFAFRKCTTYQFQISDYCFAPAIIPRRKNLLNSSHIVGVALEEKTNFERKYAWLGSFYFLRWENAEFSVLFILKNCETFIFKIYSFAHSNDWEFRVFCFVFLKITYTIYIIYSYATFSKNNYE